MTISFLPSASVASTIAPTPVSPAVAVTSTSTIQMTTQPPFIGKLNCVNYEIFIIYPIRTTKFLAPEDRMVVTAMASYVPLIENTSELEMI